MPRPSSQAEFERTVVAEGVDNDADVVHPFNRHVPNPWCVNLHRRAM
jgi:hypothetical protein